MTDPSDRASAADIELEASSHLDALLSALRTHDPEAYARAQRVARLAVALAMTLQVGEPHVSDIERAALLHGHAEGVPEVPGLAAARRIAAAVGERFDGTGSPRGLSGDTIPVGARILAVARAYDELTTARRMGASEAVTHLTTRQLPAFDPLVLGALRLTQSGT